MKDNLGRPTDGQAYNNRLYVDFNALCDTYRNLVAVKGVIGTLELDSEIADVRVAILKLVARIIKSE